MKIETITAEELELQLYAPASTSNTHSEPEREIIIMHRDSKLFGGTPRRLPLPFTRTDYSSHQRPLPTITLPVPHYALQTGYVRWQPLQAASVLQ
jgi:hypothetical protein